MKAIPIMIFFLCTAIYAHAQLNIVPKSDGLKEYTVTNAQPYDSLRKKAAKRCIITHSSIR